MGKAELENINKLVKVRKSTYYKMRYFGIVALFALLIEINWVWDFIQMCIGGKGDLGIVCDSNITYFLLYIAIINVTVETFSSQVYSGQIYAYPKNNVTAYVSQWLVTLRRGTILSLTPGIISIINYVLAYIIGKVSGKVELVNNVTPKYFIIMMIYMLTYFILADALIKFMGVIFRKSRIALMLILSAIAIITAFEIKMGKAFVIIEFFMGENNFALFEIKAIIISLLCFVIGYVLERKVKNSKNEIAGNKNRALANVLIGLLVYFTLICFIASINSDGFSVDRTVTKQKYKLELPEEKMKYEFYTDNTEELLSKGIESLIITEGKEPKMVVKKCQIDSTNNQINDVFSDLEFELSFENGKIYIENKFSDGMYLYMNLFGLSNTQMQSFVGADLVNADYKDELIDNYLTEYEIIIYLPKDYLEKEVYIES